MPCNFKLDKPKTLVPDTLVKTYKIVGVNAAGEQTCIEVNDSHQRFVTHEVDWEVIRLEFIPTDTHGCEECHVFRFEFD